MELPGLVLLLCGCLGNFSRLPVLQAEARPTRSHRVFAAVHSAAVLPCAAVTEPVSVLALSRVPLLEWLGLNGSKQILYAIVNGKKIKDQAEAYRNRTSLTEDGSLTLQDVQLSDTGDYRCVFQMESWSRHVETNVALVVVQLSDPTMKVHRSRTNQLEFECESSSRGLPPKVSVLDARGAVLTNWTGSGSEASVRVRVPAAEGSGTGNVTLICRAEVSEVQLMKENWIHIIDDFRPAGPGGSDWVLIVLMVFIVFLVLVVGFIVYRSSWRILDKLPGVQTVAEFFRRISPQGGDPPGETLLPDRASTGEEYETEYRNLDQMKTTGPSEFTIRANKLDRLVPPLSGVKASHHLARKDLQNMTRYKDHILDVGQQLHFHPALIAAIISKQSRAGAALQRKGFGFDGSSFGLMQINKMYHVAKGGPFSREHIDEGTTYLIHIIKSMKIHKKTWTPEQNLKGALVGYMMGIENILQDDREDLDQLTPTKDFASDVIARAQFFASKDFKV